MIASEMIDFFSLACRFFVAFLAFLRDLLLESPLLAFLGPFFIIAVILAVGKRLFGISNLSSVHLFKD